MSNPFNDELVNLSAEKKAMTFALLKLMDENITTEDLAKVGTLLRNVWTKINSHKNN